MLARELGKTIAEVARIPIRELIEWNVFLSLKDNDTALPKDVETDLMRIFGKPNG